MSGVHSVRFDSSANVVFDFVDLHLRCVIDDSSFQAHALMDFLDLDVSGEIQEQPIFVSGVDDSSFTNIDSKAILYVPIDVFQNTFLLNIKNDQDLIDDEYNNLMFALDSDQWNKNNYTIPFHNSMVDPSFALNPNARVSKRNIQNDFIRSIFFDITGSLKFGSLFNNSNALLSNMKSLDQPITSTLQGIFSNLGGTREDPKFANDMSNNPVRDFFYGLLNASDFKMYRKVQMIEDLAKAKNTQWTQYLLHKYYIHGMSYKGYGYYYPVYMNKNHPDLYIGYKTIRFPQYGNMDFYVNVITLNVMSTSDQIPSSYLEYQSAIHNVFIPLPFHYGDGIKAKITYQPKNTLFANQSIHSRTYNVTMLFSLETNVNLSFHDTSFVEQSKMDASASYDMSGNSIVCDGNFEFEMLWLGSQDRSSPFFSHYHYYPMFHDVSNMALTMNVVSGGSSAAFILYTRPRTSSGASQVKVDKVMFYIPTSSLVHDTMHEYTLQDFYILLNDSVVFSSLGDYLNTKINENTPYTYRGAQQILSFTLGGISNHYMNCSIHQAKIETKDGRTISISS